MENKKHDGDCYESAYKFLHSRPVTEFGELRLCHGVCIGRGGGIEGKQFIHAWCEDNLMVYDFSNGREVRMPKVFYYALGGIGEVRRYTARHSRIMATDFGHYGWWDVGCFEGVEQSIRRHLLDFPPSDGNTPLNEGETPLNDL